MSKFWWLQYTPCCLSPGDAHATAPSPVPIAGGERLPWIDLRSWPLSDMLSLCAGVALMAVACVHFLSALSGYRLSTTTKKSPLILPILLLETAAAVPCGASLYSIPPPSLAIYCLLPRQSGAVGRNNFRDDISYMRIQ